MIEAFKSEKLIRKYGGRFKLTAVIQKRWVEILNGARPMVERGGKSDLELVIEEIIQGKLGIDYEKSDLIEPDGAAEVKNKS